MQHQTRCLMILGVISICLLWNGYAGGRTAKEKEGLCAAEPCPENSVCNETRAPAICSCEPGFTPVKGNTAFKPGEDACSDEIECYGSNALKICGPNTDCVNTPGSYYCHCVNGYETKSGHATFKDPKNESCVDIDECKTANICGTDTICENTPGNYTCKCNGKSVPSTGSQPWTNKTRCLALNCRVPTSSPGRAPCTQTNALSCALNDIIASAEPTCGPFKDQQAQSEKTIQTLLNASIELLSMPGWRNAEKLNITERHQLATEMLHRIEEALRNLALLLPEKELTRVENGAYIQIWKSSDRVEDISIRGNTTQMRLNRRTAMGKRDEGFAIAGLFSFQNMTSILSEGTSIETEERTEKQPRGYKVISDVVTAFVGNDQPYNLSTPVKFTFSLREKEAREQNVVCCYRKITGNTSIWSTEGCTLTYTSTESVTCECNHLSSFAILMALYEVESWNLSVITYVGLAVSLVCLLLSIVTFMFCRSLQGTRNTIHLHLCISLFSAYAIFLAGITRVDNKVVCGIIAGLLHYFFLAAFFWMCLEGVELYLMVVKVFKTNAMKKRYMILAGYGLPLVIVGISAAVWSGGYGTEKYCWLSLKSGFIWSFMGPVCIIILLNAVIFVITVWKLAQKFSAINPDISELKKIRTFTITAIAQLCLLGCTWIIGVFQFNHNTIAMSYIFTILNCLQGTFIFILHCLMKKQVRDEYRRWLWAAANLKTPSSYDKFSSSGAFYSSSSQTRAPLRPTKESGM